MYCANCGRQFQDDDNFCARCGTRRPGTTIGATLDDPEFARLVGRSGSANSGDRELFRYEKKGQTVILTTRRLSIKNGPLGSGDIPLRRITKIEPQVGLWLNSVDIYTGEPRPLALNLDNKKQIREFVALLNRAIEGV